MLNCGLLWLQHFQIIAFCGHSFCLKTEHLFCGCGAGEVFALTLPPPPPPPQSCLGNCDILLSSRCFLSSEKDIALTSNTNSFQRNARLVLLFGVLNKG